jgi:hypothetical protein
MRSLIIGLVGAALVGLPAAAQTSCRITHTADGAKSIVSGDVTGTSIAMLVTENGPFAATLTMDPAAAHKPLKGSATLKVYRVGNSLPDKDWRQPGSVETLDGGLLMSWPGFSLRGKRVRNLGLEFSSGYTKTNQVVSYPANHAGPEAIFLRLDERMAVPANAILHEINYSQLNQWRTVVMDGQAIRVDVTDIDAGVHIATMEFRLHGNDAINARLVSDVNALRKAVAGGTCGRG